VMVFERAFRPGWDRKKCGAHCSPAKRLDPQNRHCMGCHVIGWLREVLA